MTDDVPFASPAYAAGLERDDVIVSLGGSRVTVAADIDRALMTRKRGDSLQVVYERRGERITSVLMVEVGLPTIRVQSVSSLVVQSPRRPRPRLDVGP